MISWISFETTGVWSAAASFAERARDLGDFRQRDVMQREMRNRMRTMNAPTQIPMTTHKRRPKIEVGLERSLFKNSVLATDMFKRERWPDGFQGS